MRALIVTNMYPTPARPALGSFVRDQVAALQRIDGVEVEVFAFDPGSVRAYARAARELHRRQRLGGDAGEYYDVVHAHFGLSAWPAFAAAGGAHAVTLHGTDLVHPRSRAITTAALPFLDLVATVSEPPRCRGGPCDGASAPCSRAASTSSAAGRSLGSRRAGNSASNQPVTTSSFPPTRAGPRSATTGREPQPETPSC